MEARNMMIAETGIAAGKDGPYGRLHQDVAALRICTAQSSMDIPDTGPSQHLHLSPMLEPRNLDSHGAILEEDEDETSSEPTEAITPTSDSHLSVLRHQDEQATNHNSVPVDSVAPIKPLVTDSMATSPPTKPAATMPLSEKPLSSASPMRRAKLSRATSFKLKGLFRRTTSHEVDTLSGEPATIEDAYQPGKLSASTLNPLISRSAVQSSVTSQINTPSSPGSPTSINGSREYGFPQETLLKVGRSSTGLSSRDPKIRFSYATRPQMPSERKRTQSMSQIPQIEPDNFISIPAAAGAGLKARRLSATIPDDFFVDTVELNEEFTSASMLPGKRGKVVGKGATATVKLMVRKGGSSDQVFAVKEFRKRGQNEDEDDYVKKVKSEYSIANSLHHPNVVQTVRLCTHAGRWNHVMEFCPQGDIFTLVQKRYLTLADNLCLFKQLLRGVAHLHSHGIAHRDIKLENLLMTDEGYLKITDFGVSEVFCGEHPGLRSSQGECGRDMKGVRLCAPGICGSLPYIAPEVFEKKGEYDARALDVWSCAIVLICMIHKGNPWPAADREQPHENFAKFLHGWEEYMESHPDGILTADSQALPCCGPIFSHLQKHVIKNLVLRMLHPDSNKRMSIHDAIGDRWVKHIDCCSPESCEEASAAPLGIDARDTASCKMAGKRTIRKSHHHLPPKESKLLQHRFDMGHGRS